MQAGIGGRDGEQGGTPCLRPAPLPFLGSRPVAFETHTTVVALTQHQHTLILQGLTIVLQNHTEMLHEIRDLLQQRGGSASGPSMPNNPMLRH